MDWCHAGRVDNSDSRVQQRQRRDFARRSFTPTFTGKEHAEAALPYIARLDQSASTQRAEQERPEPVIIVVTIRIRFDDRVR